MKPTNKLRFVRRAVPDKTFGENISVYKHILQQWWEVENPTDALHNNVLDGEWRDIPIEEENT
jgi:hypothetical protein